MTTSPTPPAARLGGMDLAELRAIAEADRLNAHECFWLAVMSERDDTQAQYIRWAAASWDKAAPLLSLLDALAAKAAEVERLREGLTRHHRALKHATGLVVEFGDLNGFRNLSDQELGGLVVSVANQAGHALTALEETYPDIARAALSTDEPST